MSLIIHHHRVLNIVTLLIISSNIINTFIFKFLSLMFNIPHSHITWRKYVINQREKEEEKEEKERRRRREGEEERRERVTYRLKHQKPLK